MGGVEAGASIGEAEPNALTGPPMSEALFAPTHSPPARAPVVAAVKLARRHAGRWALRGVDLSLEPGRALMVIGPNGSGKTTLIRLLGTALAPTSGSLQLFGGPAVAARARVAMLSHADHHYDDLSARENLQVYARLAPRAGPDVDAVLALVGLESRADDVVRTFSAGMRKRLAFARLLWKRADLVLLDEPYAGLDPAGGRFVDQLIRDLRAAGTTVVLSTHQVARGATLCDEAVLLEAGRVKWRGKAADAPAVESHEPAGEPQE
jgi:heme exporter protein A